jgi:hypothetical protein
LHDLPADFEIKIDPTGDVLQSFGHHSTFFTKAPVNFLRRSFFEMLDHHVLHRSSVVAGVPPANFD